MPILDAPRLLRLAKLSAAAYLVDPDEIAGAAEALGFGFVALVDNGAGGTDQGDCQALVLEDGAGGTAVCFRGTQVTSHFSPTELLDDLLCTTTHLGGGITAASGFWQPLANTWPAVARLLKGNGKVTLTGHSLGGCRAQLARLFLPVTAPVDVVSFGAPAAASPTFWTEAYGPDCWGLTRVVAEHDFAPDWGEAVGWTQPAADFLWLRSSGATLFRGERPGIDLSIGDHDVEGSYIRLLQAICMPQGAPAEA